MVGERLSVVKRVRAGAGVVYEVVAIAEYDLQQCYDDFSARRAVKEGIARQRRELPSLRPSDLYRRHCRRCRCSSRYHHRRHPRRAFWCYYRC